MTKKVMLIYPPGLLYQRGEDRCQASIDASSATSMRAANDLGYAAAVLLQRGHEVFIKDYQTERLGLDALLDDIVAFAPSMVMLSATNATIHEDIDVVNTLKAIHDAVYVLKGAIFFDTPHQVLELLDLTNVDFLIGGEVEFSIGQIADAIYPADIPNIFYKDESGSLKKTHFGVFEQNLDSIPFPARHLMNNALYTRPDTGAKMATIQTSRGCSAACIYCLSPHISGKKIRYRSPANVMAEIEDCFSKHDIRDFFFKSDTFTMDAAWVKELCELIIASPLHGKIAFTANSRTHPLTEETLVLMKRAGCFMVAFGYESGNEETMKRVKKGATIGHNLAAAKMAKKAKLPVYGFYMIGFPWETAEHIADTRKHIFDTAPDFLEVHIAMPYYGTELHELCVQQGAITDDVLGSNYFESGIVATAGCTPQQLHKLRDDIMKSFYLRPGYLAKRLLDCVKRPGLLPGYVKYGLRLIRNLFRRTV